MKSNIIILRGNSGSGKTTIAKLLQKRIGQGTFLLSQDVIRRDMLFVKDGVNTKACSLLIYLTQFGKEHSEYIILEGILNGIWYKELFDYIQREFSCIHSYYFDLPFEETIKRHNTKPNCNQFGEEDMRRWWKEKDFVPTLDEKIITRDMSENVILDMILRDIGLEKQII